MYVLGILGQITNVAKRGFNNLQFHYLYHKYTLVLRGTKNTFTDEEVESLATLNMYNMRHFHYL